jgi:hypothetical protein
MSTAIEPGRDYKDHDSDLTGRRSKDVEKIETAPEQALHFGQLSAEELEIEKKLRKKIDLRIMPVLILIYLMNYIDRYVYSLPIDASTKSRQK